MSDPYSEDAQARSARSRRNWVIAGALLLFVVIIFVVTIVHLGGHALG